MANSVSKDEVKKFVRYFRIELDKRYAAKFAPASNLNVLKSDLSTLEDEVAQINTENFVEKVEGMGLSANDFTDEHKKILEELAEEGTFDASDVADIFDD